MVHIGLAAAVPGSTQLTGSGGVRLRCQGCKLDVLVGKAALQGLVERLLSLGIVCVQLRALATSMGRQ